MPKKFFSLKKIIIILIVLAAIGGGYYYFSHKTPKVDYTLAAAKKGTISETVSETGTVESPGDLKLSFMASGRLAKVNFREGEKAAEGDIIAELDYGALSIKEKEAEAGVLAAGANRDKLAAGAAEEDVKVSRAAVTQAQSAYDSALKELEKAGLTADENNRQAAKTLSDLTSGSASDVTTYEQTVAQSQSALDTAKTTYLTALQSAGANAINAVEDGILGGQTALDKVKAVLDDQSAANYFSAKDPQYSAAARNSYNAASGSRPAADSRLAAAKASGKDADIKSSASAVLDYLNLVLSSLNSCFNGLGKSLISTDFTQAEMDAYKTGISAQISLATADISSLQSAGQALDAAILNYNNKVREAGENLRQSEAALENAKLAAANGVDSAKLSGEQQVTAAQSKADTAEKSLASAKAGLDKVLSGSNSYDVRAAEANLAQAQAGLDAIKKQIDDSILKAPISGIVTNVNYEIGEIVPLSAVAATLLGDNDFNVKIDVSEIDIAKLRPGNESVITFDSFGEGKKFSGEVYYIDTAPTIIQDVVYYQVKVRLASTTPDIALDYAAIKPGMTANVDILAAKIDGAVIIPLRAVIDRNGEGKFVRIMKNGAPAEVPVEIGMKGDEGMVEIISGVSAGDEVVTFMK